MARKTQFSDTEVFEAVGDLMAREGVVTTTAVQQAASLSTGSLYHRFGSREGMLAETWLFALRSFQPHFIRALAASDISFGEIATVTPRFCRTHRPEALVLSCCSSRQFMSSDMPPAIRRKIDESNDATFVALRMFARRRKMNLDACRLAFVAFPLAAVRLYLPDRDVPRQVDRYVARAAEAILAHRGSTTP